MEKNLVPQQVSGFKIEIFDDEVLLYHQVKTRAVYLNKTAAVIWALCDGKNSIAEIENLLKKIYPETKDSIPEDINSTLKQLSEIGAVELQ
jgi:hypothetical protein